MSQGDGTCQVGNDRIIEIEKYRPVRSSSKVSIQQVEAIYEDKTREAKIRI